MDLININKKVDNVLVCLPPPTHASFLISVDSTKTTMHSSESGSAEKHRQFNDHPTHLKMAM
jgi:hypothetical protein